MENSVRIGGGGAAGAGRRLPPTLASGLGLVLMGYVVARGTPAAAGAGVPLVLRALGQDPAQSSSIVLTTVTDVMGFLSFLGLASVFSRFL